MVIADALPASDIEWYSNEEEVEVSEPAVTQPTTDHTIHFELCTVTKTL